MIFILGPCSLENREVTLTCFNHLSKIMKGKDWIFKGSFDKANRTSLYGERGPGLEEGIEIFRELKKLNPEVKLTTDVHECWQVEKLVGVIDIIQLPAFLIRQSDLVIECAKYFDVVNLKKGQWLTEYNVMKSVDKIKETNPNCQAWICERGSSFGGYKLIVDFTIVDQLKKVYDKVLFDVGHSTQRSREVFRNQADREMVKRYFLSAPIFNYDGVFCECHPNPPSAISDADSQLYLDDIEELVKKYELIKEETR